MLEEKLQKHTIKQIMMKEYKGRFFGGLPVAYRHKKENKENVANVINKAEDLLSEC